MKVLRISLCAGLLLAFNSAVADDVLPGLWSMTVTMSSPAGEIGPFNKTQCFTEADARNPDKLFADLGGECTYQNKRYQGSSFTFAVQCTGMIPMQGGGEVSFSANSFEGSIEIQADVQNMGRVKTKSMVKGTRLGDCQKNSAQK